MVYNPNLYGTGSMYPDRAPTAQQQNPDLYGTGNMYPDRAGTQPPPAGINLTAMPPPPGNQAMTRQQMDARYGMTPEQQAQVGQTPRMGGGVTAIDQKRAEMMGLPIPQSTFAYQQPGEFQWRGAEDKALYDSRRGDDGLARYAWGSPESQRLMQMSQAGGGGKLAAEWAQQQAGGAPVPEPGTPEVIPEAPAAPTGPQAGEEVGYVDDPTQPGNQPMPEPPTQPGIAGQTEVMPPPPDAPTAAPMAPPPPAPPPAAAAVTVPAPAGEAMSTAATMPLPPPEAVVGSSANYTAPVQASIDINVKDETDDNITQAPSITPPYAESAVLPDRYGQREFEGMWSEMAPNIKMAPMNKTMTPQKLQQQQYELQGTNMPQPMPMPPSGPFQPGGQMQPNQPFPQNPVQQPAGQFDPFQTAPPQAVPPATPSPALPYAPGQGPGSGAGVKVQNPGDFNAPKFGEDNTYGGQQIAGANPNQADYGSVQNYADKAYEESQRYMAPQQAQQNRRMQQELINKGIDPNSPQGQEQQKMMAMQQGDQQNAAQFGAMQFGQGIQNQMFGQEQQQAQLAGNMQQALWGNQLGASGQDLQRSQGNQQFELGRGQLALGNRNAQNQRYGQDLNYMLGLGGQDLQRYGMDQSNQLGQGQLDLSRQGQNFNELMGMEGMNFRNNQFNQGQQNWQDQFLYNMMMGQPAPNQYQNNAMSGLGQADQGIMGQMAAPVGTAMSMFSDRRLKQNISKVGEIQGVNLYSYNYIWDNIERIGPMAQEVPWATFEVDGFLAVDPRRIW